VGANLPWRKRFPWRKVEFWNHFKEATPKNSANKKLLVAIRKEIGEDR